MDGAPRNMPNLGTDTRGQQTQRQQTQRLNTYYKADRSVKQPRDCRASTKKDVMNESVQIGEMAWKETLGRDHSREAEAVRVVPRWIQVLNRHGFGYRGGIQLPGEAYELG
jgi:hypothetical protein